MTAPSERTRDRLIEAAVRCFDDHGIDRVSLDEVATAAGVHRTTLHRQFPGGRDELVVAVANAEAQRLASRMLQLIADAPTCIDAFVDAFAFAVIEGRRSKVVAVLLSERDARSVLLGPAAVELRATATEIWKALRDRPDASPGPGRSWLATDRVIDHLFRVLLSLVSDPGPVQTRAQIKKYLRDLVVPAMLG